MGEIRTTVSFSANVAGDGLEKYPIPGTTEVEKVYFEVGDSVKAGDLIVKFDNSDAVDAYKKATINYETARLQLNETEKDYWDLKEDLDECIEDIEFYKEKWKDYEDYEIINPDADEDEIEANRLYNNYYNKWEAAKTEKESLEKQIPSADYIKIQQLNFELTKMSLDEAEDVYNNLPQDIYAQHDGVIETIGVTDYGTAAKGTVAVSILTSESNTVEFNIGRYDIGDIQVGQKATATIGGVEYPGTVTHIDSVAKDDSVRAEVTLDNPEGVVPGISAELDIETYGREMFRAGSNLSGKSAKEIFYQDYKKFSVNNVAIGVGQINSMSAEELEKVKPRLAEFIQGVVQDNSAGIVYFLLTDIVSESSEVLCAGNNANAVIYQAFGVEVKDACVKLQGVVSRKKQFFPAIVEALQQ